MIEKSVNLFPKGKPKRDIAVTERQDLTLGGRTVTIVPMPGHTPGTLSLIFQVKDNGKPLTVAFPGGTEFNFTNDVPHFDLYLDSVRNSPPPRPAAGATALMTNQSQFDNAATKLRLLKRPPPRRGAPVRASAPTWWRATSRCSRNAPRWPDEAVGDALSYAVIRLSAAAPSPDLPPQAGEGATPCRGGSPRAIRAFQNVRCQRLLRPLSRLRQGCPGNDLL